MSDPVSASIAIAKKSLREACAALYLCRHHETDPVRRRLFSSLHLTATTVFESLFPPEMLTTATAHAKEWRKIMGSEPTDSEITDLHEAMTVILTELEREAAEGAAS